MAVTFDDLKLLALQRLTSCPLQIILQRLQYMARRFLTRTEVWKYVQNRDIVAYQTAYDIELPTTNAEIKRLSAVWYGQSSIQQQAIDRVPADEYDLNLSQAKVVMSGTTSPDVTGAYYDTGQVYNSEAVYQFGSSPYYIWHDSSNWILSLVIGTKDNYFTASSLAATWTAAGSYTGSPTSTTSSGPTVSFLNAYSSDTQFGLTTQITCIPDRAYTTEIPGDVMDEWGERGFLEGALWSLKKDSKKPWEDADGAQESSVPYTQAIAEAINQRFTKRKDGDLRVVPRYFA